MLEEEDEVLGFFSSNSGEVVGTVVVQHMAGEVLRPGVAPFSSSSSPSPSPASSFLPLLLLLSFFYVLVLLVVRMGGVGENVRVNGERARGLLVMCVMEC
jgi:hypothetical protein